MAVKVTVNSTPGNRISINKQVQETIRIVGIGIVGTNVKNLTDLGDVETAGQKDGDVLVYDANSNKYVIKTIPTADGGTF